jgi:hypothetical protein
MVVGAKLHLAGLSRTAIFSRSAVVSRAGSAGGAAVATDAGIAVSRQRRSAPKVVGLVIAMMRCARPTINAALVASVNRPRAATRPTQEGNSSGEATQEPDHSLPPPACSREVDRCLREGYAVTSLADGGTAADSARAATVGPPGGGREVPRAQAGEEPVDQLDVVAAGTVPLTTKSSPA